MIPENVIKEMAGYALQYGGKCRDCADMSGVCHSGIPCSSDVRKAFATHVIKAITYGFERGFLKNPYEDGCYEAGYDDARADALRELRYAMRDIAEGDTAKARLEQLYDDIQIIAMPQDARGKG